MGLPWRNTKIDKLIACCGVLKVDDEPLAESVEHNFIEILRFYFPVAGHTRCELIPLSLWNVNRARIIVRVTRLPLVRVLDMLLLGEPRTIPVVLNNPRHVVPRNCFTLPRSVSFFLVHFHIASVPVYLNILFKWVHGHIWHI